MRQPHRIEDLELVTGFLLTEGVIEDKEDIRAIEHITDPADPKYNTVDVILASGVPAKRRHSADRNLFASSSCGICGKATQDRPAALFSPAQPSDIAIRCMDLSGSNRHVKHNNNSVKQVVHMPPRCLHRMETYSLFEKMWGGTML